MGDSEVKRESEADGLVKFGSPASGRWPWLGVWASVPSRLISSVPVVLRYQAGVSVLFRSDRSSGLKHHIVVQKLPGRCDGVTLPSDVGWCLIAKPGGYVVLGPQEECP